jgi:hypothetical protein
LIDSRRFLAFAKYASKMGNSSARFDMGNSRRLPALICYPVALGLALLAERLLLVIAEDVGLLKAIREDLSRLPETFSFTIERIALCAFLVLPALYAVDWLVKSRSKSIAIGFVAFLVVLWFWAP